MTYSEVVEAVARSLMDESEALILSCCEDLLELCEMAASERKAANLVHDVPMTIALSSHVCRRRLH